MGELTRRMASLEDVQGIWGLLRQIAADVPFQLDDEREQESLLSELVACCTSGLSPVAVDHDKGIVGVLLARRDDLEWGLRNNPAIHISYAALAPTVREGDVFAQLVSELQDQKVDVFASVKSGEQQGLAQALDALGFTHEIRALNGWGDLYQWSPVSKQ